MKEDLITAETLAADGWEFVEVYGCTARLSNGDIEIIVHTDSLYDQTYRVCGIKSPIVHQIHDRKDHPKTMQQLREMVTKFEFQP